MAYPISIFIYTTHNNLTVQIVGSTEYQGRGSKYHGDSCISLVPIPFSGGPSRRSARATAGVQVQSGWLSLSSHGL